MIFKDFDFDILNDVSFKEDAVREEILVPIIKKLGFKAFGDRKILRSKMLKHPFVYIGSYKKDIKIIPDYILISHNRPLLVIDAKSPRQNITKGKNVEQAYSYAIHPEVRSFYYGLCNGYELIIFSVFAIEPILRMDIKEIDKNWDILKGEIHQIEDNLPKDEVKNFDYGMQVTKSGVRLTQHYFYPATIVQVYKMATDIFLLIGCIVLNNSVMFVSFRTNKKSFAMILRCLNISLRNKVRKSLEIYPFAFLAFEEESFLKVNLSVRFGKRQGFGIEHNLFMPFRVLSAWPFKKGQLLGLDKYFLKMFGGLDSKGKIKKPFSYEFLDINNTSVDDIIKKKASAALFF